MSDESFGSSLMGGGDAGSTTSAPDPNTGGITTDQSTSSASTPTSFSGDVAKPSFMDIVPDEFKEELWVKDLARNDDGIAAFFKQHKDAQAMIGKRVAIPTAESTPEEITAYRKALGVPEKAEGYEYQLPDVSKEPDVIKNYIDVASKDTTMVDKMRAVAFENNVTPQQWKALTETFDAIRLDELRATFEASNKFQEERIASQRKAFGEIFGDKAEHVERIAKETAAKVLSDKVKATGDTDIALFEAMKFIHEHIYKGDSVNSLNGDAIPGRTPDQIHSEIMKLRQTDDYKNQWHPNHGAMERKIDQLYIELNEAKSAALAKS